MATFQIHEDSADIRVNNHKANGAGFRKIEPKDAGAKQQRKTLAQLNNQQHGLGRAQAHHKTVLQHAKPSTGLAAQKVNDENDVPRQMMAIAAKKALTVTAAVSTINTVVAVTAATPIVAVPPVDQFKAFCVYEDENKRPDGTAVAGEASFSICSDINLSVIRHPLQELKNDHLETPMSVTDLMSPMSVDKSAATTKTSGSDNSMLPYKSERERFYDIEEYQSDILAYLKEAEHMHVPKFGYMRKQPDINHSMRTILVDWLVEVCEEYRLQSETLCLAVSYIDRFLSVMSVVRAKLQLVGTAAMFIASKYEEIYPPDVNEFVYITDTTYTKKQVLRMEQLILKVLTFDLFVPTLFTFVNLYVTLNTVEDRVRYLATYLCELSLLEADPYLQFVPSKTAAAALALAHYTLDRPMWSRNLESRTGYTLTELQQIIFLLSKTHADASSSPQQAIQEKYKSDKYLEVSTINAATQLNEESFAMAVAHVDEEIDEIDGTASVLDESATGENVRKMISSLIFN